VLDRKQIIARFLGDMPPPPFADPSSIVAQALPALRSPRRIDVPTWASESRYIRTLAYSGRWQNDFAPYMVEPARQVTSRRYGAVVFCGPARTVKTEHLIQNTIGHRVDCMPRNMLVLCPTKDTAREFSIEKVDGMIRVTPSVAAKLGKGRGDNNIHDKRFEGGMRLRIGWPVIGQLSMFDIPDVLFTDYDRMVEDVDGEGSPFDLGRKRTQTFGSLGMTVAEGSPGRPILVDDWKPETPHQAPPTTGILSIYNRGTRGKLYWHCPDCGDRFQPLFERLQWQTSESAGQSAKTVEMVCPHCGGLIRHAQKGALNQAAVWLHETDDGELCEIDDPRIRSTDIVSYWCEGPVAAMQPWDQLVLRYLQGREEFDRTGDESSIKTTINVDQGRPYLPQVRTLGEGLNEDVLKTLALAYPMSVAPRETRFVTLSVDVQGNRFVVQADAYGVGLERWLFERFDMLLPPDHAPNADGKRAIDPGRYSEDWDVLWDLLERRWPVAGTGYGLMARAMIIDMRGAAGVTENAYRFWREAGKRGLRHRVFLANNQSGLQGDRAFYSEPEKVLGNRKKKRTDLRTVRIRTDMLKDEVALALTRKEPGPGAYHLPKDLPDPVFAEFCAEHRTDKGWEPRRSGLRNEALDLSVYSKGLVIVLKGEKIDWSHAPAWAAEMPANNYAEASIDVVAATAPAADPASELSDPAPAPAPRPRRGRRVFSKGI
jgi:phage terminase large subunit GpA-like protein